jgi:uncharacterized protein (PEP-CTERM system associated)
MSAVRMTVFKRALVCSAAFTLFGAGGLARAQGLGGSIFDNSSPAGPILSPAAAPPLITPYGTPPAASSSSPQPQLDYSGTNSGTRPLARTLLSGPAGPEFQLGATVNFSESYVTNATGSTGASQQDYLSMLGLSSVLREHTHRLSLDATYTFSTDLYAKDSEPTQFNNYLQALGSADIIPGYLNLGLRVFAQPVVTSGLGAATADNRVIPGSYSNSYGYFGNPELTFNLGNFASSQTVPSYGQIFFTTPPGTTSANTVPGVSPDNTTMRSVTESISSGPDFERLSWRLVGLYNETASARYLLTEKSGIANARYAIDHEWSILATGGYDAINDSTPLTQNVSGPVALAGIGLTLGKDFNFEFEAGERYNKLSVTSSLRYSIGPNSLITGSANDFVQTPEGQLLNNLVGLTALANGTLTSSQDAFGNGTGSPLGSFSIQSPDNPALDQFVARYQIGTVSWVQQLDRNNFSLSLFGTRRTYLVSGFTGPPVDVSWGSSLTASRSLTPLLSGSLGATFSNDQEFGGSGKTITAQAGLFYSLSRSTNVYLQSNYVTRLSSPSLQTLSPLTGSLSDFMVTVGISHTL